MKIKNPKPSRFFTATPEQRSKITQAIARGNRLQKELIENASAFVISGLITYSIHLLIDRVINVPDWQASLGYDIAQELLDMANHTHPVFFAGRNLFIKYLDYHAASLEMHAELNSFADDVYVDMNPYLQRLQTAARTQHKPTLDFFKNIFLASYQKAQYRTYLCFISGMTAATPVLQILLVDIILDRIFQRTSSYWTRKTPRQWLSHHNAEKLINELVRANSRKKSFTTSVFYGARIVAGLILLYIAIIFQDNWNHIHPWLVIFLASSVLTALKNIWLDHRSIQQEFKLQSMLDTAAIQFRKTLSEFGNCILLNKGDTLHECYLIFTAAHSPTLSSSVVNRTVKDILIKNAVDILEYNNDSLTLRIQELDNEVSRHIKQQIHEYLQAYRNINKLHAQIERFFGVKSSSIEVHLRDDDTPFVILEIHQDPSPYNIHNFIKLFPACRISITNNAITVEGNKPSEKVIHLGAGKKHLEVTSSDSSSSNMKRIVRLVKQPQIIPAPPAPLNFPPIHSVTTERWQIASKVYYSNDENVFPVENRAKTYLTFALSVTLFPTKEAYEKLKTKIEEGRMASNARGQQGLQVRPERVRDDTLPHRPFFLSHVRYKSIGIWGDIRLYARSLVNENNAKLYEFCSIKLSSH